MEPIKPTFKEYLKRNTAVLFAFCAVLLGFAVYHLFRSPQEDWLGYIGLIVFILLLAAFVVWMDYRKYKQKFK